MALNNDIDDKIKETQPLSQSAQQILQISGDENHSLLDIVKVVECDNILTANVLKMANSAAFQPKHAIDSIQMAISLLGERWVVSTALETCAKGFFDRPLDGYESEQGELWEHSLVTAIASRLVCKYNKTPIHSNCAFTAGIVHDIGKAIISGFLVGSTGQMVSEIDKQAVANYIEAEGSILETDHCEVGHALAKHWRLPQAYQDVILYHHRPDEAPDESRQLTYAVHIGDILAMMTGAGTGSDSMLYELNPNYSKHFSLNQQTIPLLLLELDHEYQQVKQSLSDLKG